MSQLQSLRGQGVRTAPSSRPAKRASVENTSFDLALAQALMGKASKEGSPPPSSPPSSRSAGSEQEAAAPHRATGADAPPVEAQQEDPGQGEVRETGDATHPQQRQDAEATPRSSVEQAETPQAESAPTSPRIDAVRIESRSGSRADASGAARPATSVDASAQTEGTTTGPARVEGHTPSTRSADAAGRSMAQERAAAAEETKEPTPAASDGSTRVTIRFADDDGSTGRIRLAVRGQTLHATIVSPDDDAVRRWSGDLDALHRSLLSQGFTDARVTVRKTPTPESTSMHRPGSGDRTEDGSARAGSATPGRDRAEADPFGRK